MHFLTFFPKVKLQPFPISHLYLQCWQSSRLRSLFFSASPWPQYNKNWTFSALLGVTSTNTSIFFFCKSPWRSILKCLNSLIWLLVLPITYSVHLFKQWSKQHSVFLTCWMESPKKSYKQFYSASQELKAEQNSRRVKDVCNWTGWR